VIPHIIHRIWLGNDPMPEPFQHFGESWRQHHPGWEMRLWTDDNLPELRYPEAFDRARNHSERSDVLRYEVVRQFGGIYADADVECLRSLEPLIEGLTAFAAYYRPGRVGSAVIGAVPNHPAFEAAVEKVRNVVGRGKPAKSTGPSFFTYIVADFPDVTIFDPEKFYPYRWNEQHRAGEDFPEAYAIHHWGSSGTRHTGRELSDLETEVERLREELARAQHLLASQTARLRAIQHSGWWQLRNRLRVGSLRRPRRLGDATPRHQRRSAN
jgi:mannosyltransferase OCH1-like enzyme